MDHLKFNWDQEIRDMRQAIQDNRFTITVHAGQDRMGERNITITDVACAIMTGQVCEGFDLGRYPNYRNPDPLRTIVGKDLEGNYITVGVAIKNNHYVVTTVYAGINNRLSNILDNQK